MDITLSVSKPEFTLEDDLLKVCTENLRPPQRKDMPNTSNRLERIDPSSDTCSDNNASKYFIQ